MTDLGKGESYESLAEHQLGRSGLVVKLDRGFEQGVYGIVVEYGEMAARVGFSAARRQALDYAARLRGQLSRMAGYEVEEMEDLPGAATSGGSGTWRAPSFPLPSPRTMAAGAIPT
jgi:hypothetical protein